MYFNLLLING